MFRITLHQYEKIKILCVFKLSNPPSHILKECFRRKVLQPAGRLRSRRKFPILFCSQILSDHLFLNVKVSSIAMLSLIILYCADTTHAALLEICEMKLLPTQPRVASNAALFNNIIQLIEVCVITEISLTPCCMFCNCREYCASKGAHIALIYTRLGS